MKIDFQLGKVTLLSLSMQFIKGKNWLLSRWLIHHIIQYAELKNKIIKKKSCSLLGNDMFFHAKQLLKIFFSFPFPICAGSRIIYTHYTMVNVWCHTDKTGIFLCPTNCMLNSPADFSDLTLDLVWWNTHIPSNLIMPNSGVTLSKYTKRYCTQPTTVG